MRFAYRTIRTQAPEARIRASTGDSGIGPRFAAFASPVPVWPRRSTGVSESGNPTPEQISRHSARSIRPCEKSQTGGGRRSHGPAPCPWLSELSHTPPPANRMASCMKQPEFESLDPDVTHGCPRQSSSSGSSTSSSSASTICSILARVSADSGSAPPSSSLATRSSSRDWIVSHVAR